MPLILDADGPLAGTLPMPATWADRFASVPNLLGAWDSAALPEGALASWAAAHGTGVFAQATAGNRPTVITDGGGRVVQWAVGKLMTIAGFTSGQPLTLAMKVNLLDAATDNQALFGGNSTWRGRFRNNTGGTFNMETSGTNANRPLTANGWHQIMVVQGASGYSIDVDGGAAATGSSAGATITSLAIGALAGNDTTTNWRGYISKIAIARAELSGDQLQTFRDWVA